MLPDRVSNPGHFQNDFRMMNPLIPKDQKIYNLHYVDIRGEFLQSPHGTVQVAVKIYRI